MKQTITVLSLAFILFSCKSKEQKIIDLAIEAHGGAANFEQIKVGFEFRNMEYTLKKSKGYYEYSRTQTDSSGKLIVDVLNNDGLLRIIDKEKVDLPDSMSQKYVNSVNSVAYFFLLPFGLNDPSVIKKYLGEGSIKNTKYDLVEVHFQQEGGGKDYQDKFVYWINKDTHLLDYLAYSYETDEGGVRFREAIDRKKIGAFTFQNYVNYGLEDKDIPLTELPALFEKGQIPQLSKIENVNIRVW